MGVRKIFSRSGATLGYFSNIFQGGEKVGKFVFSYFKLRKQPFLLKSSNFPCSTFLTPMV